jgi:SAM-dependent methyltransferase
MVSVDTAIVDGVDLSRLQSRTAERFGFEWRYFRDWGWVPELPPVADSSEKFFGGLVANTERAFWSKTLFHREDLRVGMLLLDAGCGNGRFANEAAKSGATVIGVDLGEGVLSAFDHTRSHPNVHMVRGDLFRLPFCESVFDRIYSIGVLMHTGNAAAAFASIARTLADDGLIAVHVYGRGLLQYEVIDATVRAVTTRLPMTWQMGFAGAMARAARWLRRGGRARSVLYRWLYRRVNLLPTEHHMFDWWAAPVATHHSPAEVRGWFESVGLKVLRTNPPMNDCEAERRRQQGHGSVTVLGRRNGSRALSPVQLREGG